jgi:predicted RNase H-like HicB family nuclease
MPNYIALVHKDKSSDYGASFPDFPGCISVAATLEELRPMAEEALAFHIEGMREDGDDVPEPTSLDDIVKSDDYRDAVAVVIVNVPDEEGAAVRVNITLPENTLAQIDRKAKSLGLSRSRFLAKAAKQAIHETG